eukprot:TRINITY_DN36365_c0_g1_i1.p1 TRINITY_DN36365_c0_g1~~TRINITY_DN36365_c0_g1_i1.p1  ORF type:complete len:249 (-),score=55.03 TRINITY_DN36365_c0_g1_i1:254-1000(-)
MMAGRTVGTNAARMSVTEAVTKRYSARAFLQTPIPLELIQEILAVASRAPSGGNTQPWHVYVVTGDARDALAAAGMKALKSGRGGDPEYLVYPPKDKAPAGYMARRKKCALDMYKLMGIDEKDRAATSEAMLRNWDFFGAPVAMIITVDREADKNAWGHVGMLLQTIMLLAHERSLGTCPQEAWGNLGNAVYEELGIPMDKEVVWCGLAMGLVDTSKPVNAPFTEREPVETFSKFHGFSPAPEPTSKL